MNSDLTNPGPGAACTLHPVTKPTTQPHTARPRCVFINVRSYPGIARARTKAETNAGAARIHPARPPHLEQETPEPQLEPNPHPLHFGILNPSVPRYPPRVRPLHLEPIGEELAIRWDDGHEDYIRLETLRRHCPCAGCQGEVDALGQLHKGPERPLTPTSFRLLRIDRVGGYAVQPVWADGHNSGLFTFDYLRRIGSASSQV